ncbi:netrin receptor DSCAM, putative [Ixodes scapularis]|uniref:Netrin receptor DSCAM, putative n=1 Tax=Ixodes scapularis TaxID=6945 RepID=B7PZA2_IXOSC|nr:netrin receptor DSCAM, putative [Ixodes scapularis]|eukprot:XP_002405039.1 netrin receptor DSCAM, putative [Ixodes scapularis]
MVIVKFMSQVLGLSAHPGTLGDLLPGPGSSAPAFLREPPGQLVFPNATGAVVSCSASGDPRPVLSWTNESGSPLGSVPGLRRTRPDGALEFFPFRGEDYRQDVHAAVYRCRASNTLGSISSRNVHVKAAEPRNASGVN